jgi:hypothetical protein
MKAPSSSNLTEKSQVAKISKNKILLPRWLFNIVFPSIKAHQSTDIVSPILTKQNWTEEDPFQL